MKSRSRRCLLGVALIAPVAASIAVDPDRSGRPGDHGPAAVEYNNRTVVTSTVTVPHDRGK